MTGNLHVDTFVNETDIDILKRRLAETEGSLGLAHKLIEQLQSENRRLRNHIAGNGSYADVVAARQGDQQ